MALAPPIHSHPSLHQLTEAAAHACTRADIARESGTVLRADSAMLRAHRQVLTDRMNRLIAQHLQVRACLAAFMAAA
jgi:hypothetical protein